MYKDCHNIEELLKLTEEDKIANGAGSATLNRYPIRFVLFDNFHDCYTFVEYLQSNRGVHVQSVANWIDSSYADLLLTSNELAEKIQTHIRFKSPHDCVVAPFSELARFYDNDTIKYFDTLIKQLKGTQADATAAQNHQRVYIPIVGLAGKMSTFQKDTQINVWHMHAEEEINYKLILTPNNDFGVKGLTSRFTVVSNIREWLNIWNKSDEQCSPHIICLSNAIHSHAKYAQPDNAFTYENCNNAYDFLTRGIGLQFGNIHPQPNDGDNWDRLAETIDISSGTFSFKDYVYNHFNTNAINDYKDFMRLWCAHTMLFDRWLLTRFYCSQPDCEEYLREILMEYVTFGTIEFIEKLVGKLTEIESEMTIRRFCLHYAAEQGIELSDAAEAKISQNLVALAEKQGYQSTLRYFTGISKLEKELVIRWYAEKRITLNDVLGVFPDLYHYAKDNVGVANVPDWVKNYFTLYKQARLQNTITSEIAEQISELNASESSFIQWYNAFSDTYTLLLQRKDIEVFFWIDGLGVEWIPYIKQIIEERQHEQIYLNEIKIACAKYPTITSINKANLQRLVENGDLEKMGDLDALAHSSKNTCPAVLIQELALVRKAITTILSRFSGKKIAIISDHGLTYLSQRAQGKNLAGYESDHHGRLAIRKNGAIPFDPAYIRLEDGKTICALRYESLCGKVPSGQGIHGGCTPEEILVPIFIISNQPTITNWSAQIIDRDISGASPIVKFKIKGLNANDIPVVIYNGITYSMHYTGVDEYHSDNLPLDVSIKTIDLVINNTHQKESINIDLGVQENDMFGF